MNPRKGQIAIWLAFAILALAIIALMNADVFLSITRKNESQNAGDAAALAAARVQGRLLNRIGALNIEHIDAVLRQDEGKIASITNEQARLAILGPVSDALPAAQNAAKQNHTFVDDDMTRVISDEANYVRNSIANEMPPEEASLYYEYANKLSEVANEGIAAGPDNSEWFMFGGGHLLQSKDFYQAVNGQNWCWFFFGHMDLLNGYGSYHDWDPLPSSEDAIKPENSEIFSLHVSRKTMSVMDILDDLGIDDFTKLLTDNDYTYDFELTREAIGKIKMAHDVGQMWYCYDGEWGDWQSEYELTDFMTGDVKPEYNVAGCAAVCRVKARLTPTMPNVNAKDIVWTAAAKPFGYLESASKGNVVATYFDNIVFPCFTTARLIPIDATSGGDGDTADSEWVYHLFNHLGKYMDNGPGALNASCGYCLALKTWENAGFREKGKLWLTMHSGSCRRPRGGGTSYSGGRKHGH